MFWIKKDHGLAIEKTFVKKRLLIAAAASFSLAIGAQKAMGEGFTLDLDLQSVDAYKQTIRVSDLAVNDLAVLRPSEFCIADNMLFLPSNTAIFSPRDASVYYLRVRLLPSKRLEATLVPPTEESTYGGGDPRTGLIVQLSEPMIILSEREWSCKAISEDSRWPVDFYRVESINGHSSLSELADEVYSQELPFED